MLSETQPLINSKTSTTPSVWYKSNKAIGVAIVALVIIITSIFYYTSQHFNNNVKQYDISSTSSWSWTTIETIQVDNVIKSWKWSQDCPDDDAITLTFAIKQSNTDKISDVLNDVSDPKSANYGKYWSWEQIHDFLKPSDEAISTVTGWLRSQGISEENIVKITPNSDAIRVKTTIKKANEMLNTKYGIWKHVQNEEEAAHIRVKDVYYVPDYVSQHLDFVSPTVRFPLRKHVTSTEFIASKDNMPKIDTTVYVTPSKLRLLYNYPSDFIASAEDNRQCIASFLEEWYNDDDLEEFWTFFDIESANMIRMPEVQPEGYGSEAELDVQYITSTGEGIETIVWDIEDDGYFITLVEQISASETYPYVVSMSYGGDEQSNGIEYCSRGNVEFAKGSLLGITFFASSGDDGATGSEGECTATDNEYLPSFPATSYYVTAVGGTYGGNTITSDVSVDDYNSGELAWYNSGGGFSVFFSRLSFQDNAVTTYLSSNTQLPSSSRYNTEGRAYPDISAQSVAYIICYELQYYAVSGTSCSSPTVAGMFSVINDLRLKAGKSTLGWLNPALYALYDSGLQSTYFNDVVSGYNEGCSIDDSIAFYAQAGWDPVTGLGTPKLTNLIDYFINL